MKKYIISAGIMMMSYFGISQDLTPQVLLIKNKKHFCFNSFQSKELAKLLEKGSYNDSLVTQLSITNNRLVDLLQKKDSLISFKNSQLYNYKGIIDNKEQHITVLNNIAKQTNQKLKKGKLHKMLLLGSLVVASTLLLSK
ncbi:hypothetical protein HN014_10775 [Aquimarina sp. TRL1]|uniref:hypothetical protein n=1 Tax=Aquimarina sp. (strain TRL1) TaxID=2736252 RepID=UPI00158EF3BF|nr:hypothetical protein [Aquimarina sp. TRL1]QKX05377.1 hypothetical protein HN014_10775 [Aquimarina sp. TRL1]